MTRRIPLFPLGTVLYPGLIMPLHIFEPRYRMLVQRLINASGDQAREFGVVAIREGLEAGTHGARSLHPIGCAATLREVEAYEDGRFDVTTVGTRRFRIISIDTSAPLWEAEVEDLDEPAGAPVAVLEALTRSVNRSFARYRAALQGAPEELDDLATSGLEAAIQEADGDDGDTGAGLITDPQLLAYAVAAAMILDVSEKQFLLAATSTAARLGEERRLLDRERTLIRLIPSLPGVEITRSPISPN